MEKLDLLIENIGIAIRKAQAQTELFSLENYKNWFEEEEKEDGTVTLKPKMLMVSLPNPDGSTYYEEKIPIVALLNHHSLVLSETRIKMRIVSRWDINSGELMVEVGPFRKETEETPDPHSDACEIELVFKAKDGSEGTARYVDKFIRTI